MTPSEESRLAVVESEMKTVKSTTDRIESKLDLVIETKADCAHVEAVDARVTEVRGWVWGIAAATIVSLIGALVALLGVAFQLVNR